MTSLTDGGRTVKDTPTAEEIKTKHTDTSSGVLECTDLNVMQSKQRMRGNTTEAGLVPAETLDRTVAHTQLSIGCV